MHDHPEVLDGKNRAELYARSAGILVRKETQRISSHSEDLTKKGIKIVDVNGAGQLGLWEDLAGRKGLIPGISRNIDISVKSSAEAINLWKANSKLDAWITYESWHYRLADVTDLVQLLRKTSSMRGPQ